MAWLNFAVTAELTGTAVAPLAGVTDVTVGAVGGGFVPELEPPPPPPQPERTNPAVSAITPNLDRMRFPPFLVASRLMLALTAVFGPLFLQAIRTGVNLHLPASDIQKMTNSKSLF